MGAKKAGRPEYSIVVPAYREAVVIEDSLRRLQTYLKGTDLLDITEVIVVTADSSDETAAIVRRQASLFPNFQFIQPGPKVGKGRDVRLGVLAAQARYILFTDADLATPEHHIAGAFRQLKDGADLVVGVRNLKQTHTALRAAVSGLANQLVRVLRLSDINDTQCGFKGFRRDAANLIFKRTTIRGWGFDVEVLAIARLHGLKVKTIKIYDWHDPKLDQGLVGEPIWAASYRTFKEVLQIYMRVRAGRYK